MATASRQRSSSASRTLPTRKSKAATEATSSSPQNNNNDDSNSTNNGIESRQESKSHDSPGSDHRSMNTAERIPSPPSRATTTTNDGKDNVAAMLEKEQRDNSNNSSNATMKQQGGKEMMMQPAFNLNDIGTLSDHPPPPTRRPPSRQSPSPPTRRHRSASPPGTAAHSTSAISRRGRSRSPVGLTPHHHHHHHSNSSRSNSRNNSRPTSRIGNGDGRCASAATVQASGGVGNTEEMSLAALAAGEAAANNLASLNNIQPMPYKDTPRTSNSRSPSPTMQQQPQGIVGVSKFPSASMSFEISSPQPSMSFGGLGMMGGLGDSFDWMPQHQSHQQQSVVPHNQQQYHGGGGHRGGRGEGGRSPSPGSRHTDYPGNNSGRYSEQQQSRHPPPPEGHGYYNYPPPATQAGGGYHHHHTNSHFSSSRGRSPSPPSHHTHHSHHNNNGYYSDHRYSSSHPNHHNHHHRSSSSRHSRSSSPVLNNGRNEHLPRRSSVNQQPLFPEHHVHSPVDTTGGVSRSATVRSRSASPTKRSTKSGTKNGSNNNKATHRSSVFRGSPQRPDTDNLPQELLLALEEEDDSSGGSESDSSPDSPAVKKRKGGGSTSIANKGNNKSSSKKGKGNTAKGSKKKDTVQPKRGKELNKSSMTNNDNDDDDVPPTSTSLSNPSMLLDPHQIDACLQDTSLNLNVMDDYLNANLSFRKSYDLEQVFSFIKEPNGGGLNGALSFNLGFSNDDDDDDEDLKNKTKSNNKNGIDLGIHTLRSQSSMGLTPINSFSESNNNKTASSSVMDHDGNGSSIVPLNSMDGKELRAFLSSSPNTLLTGSSGILKIGSPKSTIGRKQPLEAAPVVHSTPPSYSSQGHEPTYGGGGGSSSSRARGSGLGSRSYTATTPPSHQHDHHHHSGISMSFPNKRIKLSTRHSIHPIALDLNKRGNGDYFGLLRKLKPAFVGFRFVLPEMDGGGSSSVTTTSLNVVSESSTNSPHSPHHTNGMLDERTMIIAKRRISSSICAFGGSLPPRTVSPSPQPSLSSVHHPNSPPSSHGSVQVVSSAFASSAAEVTIKEETSEERDERYAYESSLSSRYFMKEGCVSWDVELHEVIAAKPGKGGKKNKQVANSTPKPRVKKQIGVFKGNDTPTKGGPPGGGKYCAPVTPSTPGNLASASSGSPGTPSDKKGSKIVKTKYRCKLCGLPKQNHTCTYKASLVRSIGTMVYPAVNAFVSNEPGRLAPALSEMNNFTSLLSHDTTRDASLLNGVGTSFGMFHRSTSHHPSSVHRIGPYGNVLTPETSHWSPTTPGGLSTMSSPGSANSPGTPGTPVSAHNRKRDHHHLMMSRTMSMGLTATPRPPPVPHVPSMPPAPAGAIPHDVLFRDTMELKKEQYRTVGGNRTTSSNNVNASSSITETSSTYTSNNITPTSGSTPNNSPGTTTSSSGSSSVVKESSPPITESITDYRYPQIPTPYAQRKEMGDTLFALSREVPNLADSCAAILREARENDAWDQAVAELTTQVLVVLKCEECDYTLEGLRRHLLSLGIAC